MKKVICLAFTLMLVIETLTACGRQEQETVDDNLPVLTLALRDGIYSDVIQESVRKFEEEEQVHCEILELSEDELRIPW